MDKIFNFKAILITQLPVLLHTYSMSKKKLIWITVYFNLLKVPSFKNAGEYEVRDDCY